MECSAKDNYNITELFKTLLSLSKIIPAEQAIETNGGPWKRRSSAYVSATSKGEWTTSTLSEIFINQLNSLKKIVKVETVCQAHRLEMRNRRRRRSSHHRTAMAEVKHLAQMENQSQGRGKTGEVQLSFHYWTLIIITFFVGNGDAGGVHIINHRALPLKVPLELPSFEWSETNECFHLPCGYK